MKPLVYCEPIVLGGSARSSLSLRLLSYCCSSTLSKHISPASMLGVQGSSNRPSRAVSCSVCYEYVRRDGQVQETELSLSSEASELGQTTVESWFGAFLSLPPLEATLASTVFLSDAEQLLERSLANLEPTPGRVPLECFDLSRDGHIPLHRVVAKR